MARARVKAREVPRDSARARVRARAVPRDSATGQGSSQVYG